MKNISGGGWTVERVELLKKLWPDGLSASQIASELGGITRNAVISKIHRLGLSGRSKGAQRRAGFCTLPAGSPPLRRARPSAPEGVSSVTLENRRAERQRSPSGALPPREEQPELIEIPVEQRKTLLQLSEKTCHWPVGDPGSTEFFFCGGESAKDKPYCTHHSIVANPPAAQRRRTGRIYR